MIFYVSGVGWVLMKEIIDLVENNLDGYSGIFSRGIMGKATFYSYRTFAQVQGRIFNPHPRMGTHA